MLSSLALYGNYDLTLVGLSILIALLAAQTALDLGGRVATSVSSKQITWLVGGSTALGLGIWSMHYVGMGAYHLPVPVLYDWPTVLASLLAAILASAVALNLVKRPNLSDGAALVGSLIMGGGISAMHYIGMMGMRLAAIPVYSSLLVALSVIVALTMSYFAIRLVFSAKGDSSLSDRQRALGTFFLGLGIPAMHYIGMASVRFYRSQSSDGNLNHAITVSPPELYGLASSTLILLTITTIATVVDRRAAQRVFALYENQLHFQTIFDHLKEGLLVFDRDLNIVEANTTAIRTLGIATPLPTLRSDLAQLYKVCSPDGIELPTSQWPSALALNGEYVDNSEVLIVPRGSLQGLLLEVSTAPILDRAGELTHIILCYRDVTQPKAIDLARTRLAAIVESSEDAIIGKDLNGIVNSWNAGAQKIFGYSYDEMLGQSIKRLLPDDRLDEEEDILARIRKGEIVDHIETIRKKKNGQFIHVSLTISPVKNSAGVIIGASKIARDITERKQLERRLFESQKMEAIGQLTGGIAHDFNNLLSVIIGNLDLLDRIISSDERAMQRVRTAQKAALRGADLTRRLLGFSSRDQLHPATVRIEEPIRTTIDLAARALGPDITFNLNFDHSVPPIFVDVASLENALLNMFVNARDAMPKGGTITITTELSHLDETSGAVQTNQLKAGDYAYVSVSDTGAGMSRETMDRAFEPFFTTKERDKGTGLGLAMVYGFFKQSDGLVRLYSEVGYGTTVSFYLPTAKKKEDEERKAVGFSPIADTPRATILLVDDEPDLLEVGKTYLETAGYTVYTASNGHEALDAAKNHPEIAILLTDIIMPGGINGVELAELVRGILPTIRVIYCSGFPANALVDRDMSVADGELLRKPYQRNELLGLVRHKPQDRSTKRTVT